MATYLMLLNWTDLERRNIKQSEGVANSEFRILRSDSRKRTGASTRPRWKFRLGPVAAALAVAILRFAVFASDDVTAGTLPKDACMLLKPAEIQAALDGNTDIGSGVPDASTLPVGVSCSYTWGPRTKEYGQSALTITVIDASKAWQGRSSDLIQQGILLKTKTSGPDASVISGIGDAAMFTFEARSSNALAEAYFKTKDMHLALTFHRGDSVQNKDKLIALLKQAGARL